MSKVAFSESWSKVNERGISRIEDRLQLQFPPQYKKFLLRQNGGIPRPGILIIDEKEYKISLFYSIGGGQDKDICYAQKRANLFLSTHFSGEERKNYEGFLIIAEDSHGNYIFLGTDGDTEGHVYHFDKKAKIEPLTLLSNSFSEFINMFPGADGSVESELTDEDSGKDDDEDYTAGNTSEKKKRGKRRKGKYDDDDDDE